MNPLGPTLVRFSIALVMASAVVRHRAAAEEEPFHFQYDIAPHLARAGCAAAECHGGATGRGGFKLSLFATNPRADYEAITQDRGARRIDHLHPGQSLILRKPSKQVKHGGGRVIDPDDPTYAALSAWICEGAPFSSGTQGKLSALDLTLDAQQLAVSASFALPGGRTQIRDVTHLARFESTDARVVAVSGNGRIEISEPGEAWLVARYGELAARLPLVHPFSARPATPPNSGVHENPLDRIWLARLAELNLEAAAPANPYQLLRRLYLDLTGRPPAPDEIGAFFDLPEPTRVAETSARLIQSDEFADRLALFLQDWFEVPPPGADLNHTSERNARLRTTLLNFARSGESLADFSRDMFVQRSGQEFIQRFGDPRDRAEFTTRTLLGVNIACARCHNHPLDRWSQTQHLQFSAFFTDQRPSPKPGSSGGEMMMAPGKFFLPGDGKPIAPALLPIGPSRPVSAEDKSEESRRARLAQFVTHDAADALARNVANRVFGLMIGKHLVEAPEDHRLSNPAIHEPVLALLAEELRAGKYQLRPLVQLIATSRLYATGSAPPDPENLSGDPQRQFFARREARSMSGAQFDHAIEAVLGVPLGISQPPDTPLAQQLHLLNSGIVQRALATPGNQVDAIFDFESDPVKQLGQLYLLILSRPPNEAERREFLPLLNSKRDTRSAARDLAFALIASREFGSIR